MENEITKPAVMDEKRDTFANYETADIMAGELNMTAEKTRKLLWKIDLHLLPFMLITYMLQFLDKTTLGYAAIMGLPKDTHLVGQDYSWASSLFYVGYLIASYPFALVFVKLPLGKSLSITILVWAVILTCHSATTSFATLGTVRTLLGVFEAAISPGFSLITSIWYEPSEHASRHALWFAGNSVAGLLGGLLSYAISHIRSDIAAWRWLYIIFGSATFIWSLVLLFFLPDNPLTAKFLTPEERSAAFIRAQGSQHTKKTGEWKKAQFIEAFKDPKTWLLFTFTFLTSVPNGGLTNFGSIILAGFGYSTLQTQLLSMAVYAFQLLFVLGGAFAATYFANARCITMAVLVVISVVGTVMIRQVPITSKVPRMAGLWLCGGYGATFPLMLSLVASNVTGYTKRTTVSALVFVAYCAGNITGPQTFYTREAPAYKTGILCMLICFVLSFVTILVLRQMLQSLNKKRDREQGGRLATIDKEGVIRSLEDTSFDETDWENTGLRYML